MNFSSFLQNERLMRWVAITICGLGILACLSAALKLVSVMLPSREATSLAVTSTQTSAKPSSAPEVPIAKWHLFGNPELGITKTAAPLATQLNLYLRGTLALENPRLGMAVIADEQGEHAYHVGEMVADGARLDSVYTDHVVVVHEGVSKTLTLPKLEDSSSTTSSPSIAPAPRPKDRAGISPTASAASPSKSPSTQSMEQKLPADPAELARQIQAVPVMEGGKITGVRLNPGNQAALLSKYGWQPNDIVTAINGTSVMSLTNPQQLLDSLKTGGQIQVTVSRDGKPATLTVSLR